MLFEMHPDDVCSYLRPGVRTLLACVHRDEADAKHRVEVERAADAFPGKVFAFWTEAPLSPGFMQLFSIHGTPTYLLLDGTGELGRLEGRADASRLKKFVRSAEDELGRSTSASQGRSE